MAANSPHLPLKTAPGMSRRFPIIDLLRNLHLKRRAEKIAASALFDAGWYLHRYPDVVEAGMAPALHYVRIGADENRWPNPLFDPDWFERHAGSRGGRKTPLERYLALPVAGRPSTHPLIDPDWYRHRHSDRLSPDQDVLEHFLMHGASGKLSPHPAFDSAWYLARYPDIAGAGVNPLVHYIEFGAAEGRNPNPFFDSAWYASRNLEAGHGDLNPLVHYLQNVNRAALANRVAGWAWWSGGSDEPVEVEIWINEELADTVPALERRPGLCHLMPPRGGYVGFHLPVELKSGDKVRCRVARTGQWFPLEKAEIFR